MSVCPCMAMIWRLKKALTELPVLYPSTWGSTNIQLSERGSNAEEAKEKPLKLNKKAMLHAQIGNQTGLWRRGAG